MNSPGVFADLVAQRACWHPVAFSSDVAGRPAHADLLGEPLVVWRGAHGGLRVMSDLCVHRGTALSLGWIQGDELVCAYRVSRRVLAAGSRVIRWCRRVLRRAGRGGADLPVDRKGLPRVRGGFARLPSWKGFWPIPSRARACSRGAPMSRAMARVWVWWPRAVDCPCTANLRFAVQGQSPVRGEWGPDRRRRRRQAIHRHPLPGDSCTRTGRSRVTARRR